MTSPRCSRCRHKPEDLSEYVQAAAEYGMSPDDYVREYEGTWSPRYDLFFCTPCYLAIGAPTSHMGIRALPDGEWEVG